MTISKDRGRDHYYYVDVINHTYHMSSDPCPPCQFPLDVVLPYINYYDCDERSVENRIMCNHANNNILVRTKNGRIHIMYFLE